MTVQPTFRSSDALGANAAHRTTTVAVCSLFEGDYHFGLGALVNSLVVHGFTGEVFAGFRGELPPWAAPVTSNGALQDFYVNDSCVIHFVPLTTQLHLTNYKPWFMIDVLETFAPTASTVIYFDPDIVTKCRWSFFEEWSRCGVALVQDVNGNKPADHPFRHSWLAYARSLGISQNRELSTYFNAGFVAVRREWIRFLETWKLLLESLPNDVEMNKMFPMGETTHPFNMPDQDCFNIATMVTDVPLSTVGAEQMDFAHGGVTMSHAVGSPKPWQKRMLLSALNGKGPSLCDQQFWRYVNSPINLLSRPEQFFKKLDLLLGAAVGRVIRRA